MSPTSPTPFAEGQCNGRHEVGLRQYWPLEDVSNMRAWDFQTKGGSCWEPLEATYEFPKQKFRVWYLSAGHVMSNYVQLSFHLTTTFSHGSSSLAMNSEIEANTRVLIFYPAFRQIRRFQPTMGMYPTRNGDLTVQDYIKYSCLIGENHSEIGSGKCFQPRLRADG